MRRILSSLVGLAIAFGPVAPVHARGLRLPSAETQTPDTGEFLTLQNAQQAQAQEQEQQLQLRNISKHLGAPVGEVSFTLAPTYDGTIGVNDAFSATFHLHNDTAAAEDVVLVAVLTKVGTTDSTEFGKVFTVNPGNNNGQDFVFTLSNAELDAAGIEPGRYLITFLAFDDQEVRIDDGFFGNPLTIGDIEPTFTAAPTYDNAIGVSESFTSQWSLGNTGDTADNVTMTIIITPAGTNNSKEFSTIVSVGAGGGSFAFNLTNAQLDAQGITGGTYVVSFLAYDGVGNKIGDGFAGNLLQIGASNPGFSSLPSYSSAISTTANFTATFSIANTGNVPANLGLVTVITPAGTTNSQEFDLGVTVNPGGGNFTQTITDAQLNAAGLTGGAYVVTFKVVDGNGAQVGQAFFGNPLQIGSSSPTFTGAPSYDNSIGLADDFSSAFTIGNSGTVPANLSLVTVITPAGNEAGSQEFGFGVTVNPGGGTFTHTITDAQLNTAGFNAGNYVVTYKVVDGAGTTIGQTFFGNLLQIGPSPVAFPFLPEYSGSISTSANFTANYIVDNNGATAPAGVSLLTIITKTGGGVSQEFETGINTTPGRGTYTQTITNAQLDAQGITGGVYTVTFKVLDGNGVQVGDAFFGNILNIGSSAPTFNNVPSYDNAIGAGEDLASVFQIGNGGAIPVTLSLVTVVTPAGNEAGTQEFNSAAVTVEPGGGFFTHTITNAQLDAAGLTGGNYVVTYKVVDGAGNTIGQTFFGNLLQIGPSPAAFPFLPEYSGSITQSGNFTANWIVDNNGAVAPAGVSLLTVITQTGGGTSQEFETGVNATPGRGTYTQTITNAQLDAKGITGGVYTVTFKLLDGDGNQIGDAFFGNILNIGSAGPTFTNVPSYDGTLSTSENFAAVFNVGNSGVIPATVQLVTVITPAGNEAGSKEFGSAAISVEPGGGFFTHTITNAELDAQGLTGGAYVVTFKVVNGEGTAIGQSFFGNLLQIGASNPGFTSLPTYTDQISTTGNFTAQFTVANTGDVPFGGSVITVITPAGTTNSQEFEQAISVNPGGGTFTQTITDAQLNAAGLTGGAYVVTFKVVNGAGVQVGDAFFGNVLQIGTSGASFSELPDYPNQISLSGDFSATFEVGNPGDVPSNLTLVVVITPAGQEELSKEFDFGVTVNPGGGIFTRTITNAQLDANGLTGGDYVVTFKVVNGDGDDIGDPFYGNLLRIGTGPVPAFTVSPTYSPEISPIGDFTANFTLGNTGDVPFGGYILVVFRNVDDDPNNPASFKEFYKEVTVPVGGTTVQFKITDAELNARGINSGRYLLTFKAYDGTDTAIGTNPNPFARGFFGQPLTIGEFTEAFDTRPTYEEIVAPNEDFTADYTIESSQNQNVVLLAVFTSQATGSIEVYQQVQVTAGVGTYRFRLTPAQRAALGITGRVYTVAFVVYNGADQRIGAFFGNIVDINETP